MICLNKNGRKCWSVKLLTQVAQPFLTPQNYKRCPSSNAKKHPWVLFAIIHDTRSDSTSPYAETLFFVSSANTAHAKKS